MGDRQLAKYRTNDKEVDQHVNEDEQVHGLCTDGDDAQRSWIFRGAGSSSQAS